MNERLASCLKKGTEAWARKDFQEALRMAREAYAIRKQEPAVWQLLFRACLGLQRFFEAGFWEGLYCHRTGHAYYVPDTPEEKTAILQGIGFGTSEPMFAPYHLGMLFSERKTINSVDDIVLGDCLPDEADGTPGYFVGVFNPQNKREVRGMVADLFRSQHMKSVYYGDMVFDLMRASCVQDVSLQPDEGETYIQPVAAADAFQHVHAVLPEGLSGDIRLSKYETTFLRVDKPVRLSSEAPFWLGKPILMQHDDHRRKVVLNILLDGLSWGAMKRHDFEDIPNIMAFVSKGLIFDQVYAGSEYTYPSLATIETGMMPTRSQIFSSQEMARLEPERKTLSEQMRELGYYTVCVQGSAEGIFNGVSRGFDRMILNHSNLPSGVGVERAIEQLEAFGETDQFLFLWTTDSHPFNNDMSCAENVQTQLPLEEQFDMEQATSVHLRSSQKNQLLNRQNIRDMDRQLGLLFRYLTEHYADDEYLVCLYSDHGCSVYSEHPWLLSQMHTNSALMLRGKGVPKGVRTDELVSTADIYAILGHYAGFSADAAHLDSNLPEVCGGKRRERVLSHSIFPEQTRKICLRTQKYVCRFETEHFTEIDGSVWMEPFSLHVWPRENEAREDMTDMTEVRNERVRKAFRKYFQRHADEFMLKMKE